MKLAFYLTDNRNIRDGVTHYATEIINRAPKEFECVGEAFFGYKDKTASMREHLHSLTPGLPLKTKRIFLPMRFIGKLFHRRLPFSYEFLMGSRADARVFFHNFLPRCRMKGKKIVVIHDLTPLHDPKATKRKIETFEKKSRRTVERADLIFTDSEFSKADIIGHFPRAEEKLRVLYCGIDQARFSAPVSEEKLSLVREKYGLPERYLLFMGQARQNKNLENLLRGFALLPKETRERYPLVLANHTPALGALAEELGLKEAVLLGGIDEGDVTAIYHGAHALALLSTSEGFGLPLVEAMAAGIPTIASNATCLPEIAGDASYFADPFDPQSIAGGLNAVLTDEALRESLIKKGKEQIKRYSWDLAAETFYAEIAALMRKK